MKGAPRLLVFFVMRSGFWPPRALKRNEEFECPHLSFRWRWVARQRVEWGLSLEGVLISFLRGGHLNKSLKVFRLMANTRPYEGVFTFARGITVEERRHMQSTQESLS